MKLNFKLGNYCFCFSSSYDEDNIRFTLTRKVLAEFSQFVFLMLFKGKNEQFENFNIHLNKFCYIRYLQTFIFYPLNLDFVVFLTINICGLYFIEFCFLWQQIKYISGSSAEANQNLPTNIWCFFLFFSYRNSNGLTLS